MSWTSCCFRRFWTTCVEWTVSWALRAGRCCWRVVAASVGVRLHVWSATCTGRHSSPPKSPARTRWSTSNLTWRLWVSVRPLSLSVLITRGSRSSALSLSVGHAVGRCGRTAGRSVAWRSSVCSSFLPGDGQQSVVLRSVIIHIIKMLCYIQCPPYIIFCVRNRWGSRFVLHWWVGASTVISERSGVTGWIHRTSSQLFLPP